MFKLNFIKLSAAHHVKHFYGVPLERKFFNFSFQNGIFWRTLYFWPTAGPLNVAGGTSEDDRNESKRNDISCALK